MSNSKFKNNQEERRAQLVVRLGKAGVESFHNLERKLPRLRRCKSDGVDATSLVTSYLKRGYPTLEVTVKVLSPALRQFSLEEQSCWIEASPRCLAFVADTGEFPDVGAVKIALLQDKQERLGQLQKEFDKHCLLAATKAQRSHLHEDADKEFVDQYVGMESYEIRRAAIAFIKKGVGRPSSIANAVAAEARRQSLVTALSDFGVICPWELQHTLEYAVDREVRSCNPKIDEIPFQQIASFIFGESKGLRAKDVVEEMQNVRRARQAMVDSLASESSLDLEEIRRSYRFNSLVHSLERFVEDGTGDASQIIATIGFDQALKKHGLPERGDLFRISKDIKTRFDATAAKDCKTAIKLAQDLADERMHRLDEVICSLLSSQKDESGHNGFVLSDEYKKQIETSMYVQFGVGSGSATVTNVGRSVRRSRLQQAMNSASRALGSTFSPIPVEHDERLQLFVQGRSSFDEKELVSKLVEEQSLRVVEVEELLKASNIDIAFSQTYRLQSYISLGVGSPHEAIEKELRRSREEELERLLQISEMPEHLYTILECPLCEEYIEGKSSLTCEKLVEKLVTAWKARKKCVQNAIEGCDETETSLLHDHRLTDYAFIAAVEDYVRTGNGDFSFIASGIEFHSRLCKTKRCFGTLSGMLPDVSFRQVSSDRDELKEI